MNYSSVSYKGLLTKVIFLVYICTKRETDVDNSCVCMYVQCNMIGRLERNHLMLHVIGPINHIETFLYKTFRILITKFLLLRYKMVWLSCTSYGSNPPRLVGALGIVLLGPSAEIARTICIIICFMDTVI